MEIDPQYTDILREAMQEEIDDKRKELAWDLEYSRIKVKKLTDYVKNELEVDHFVVKALRNEKKSVQSFKLKRMSSYLHEGLKLLNEKLDQ